MELLSDTIEAEKDDFFNVLICLRHNPTPQIAVAISVQVLNQNGNISNIGGWIVHYGHPIMQSQELDDFDCVLDAKIQIRHFLSGNCDKWEEPQPSTFLLKQK